MFWAGLMAVLVVPATIGAAVGSAGAAGSNTLTVKAGEYTYKLPGSPKAGWTQINFDNGGVEYHMMAVFALEEGRDRDAAQEGGAVAGPDGVRDDRGPNAGPNGLSGRPDLLGPGQPTTMITKLPAGHYGMLCFVPAPDGTPHVAHGMVKTFDVSKSKSSLKPPTNGVTAVTIIDNAITLPTDNIGRNVTLKVTNSGSAVHASPGQARRRQDARRRQHLLQRLLQSGRRRRVPAGELVGGISCSTRGPTCTRADAEARPLRVRQHAGNAPDDDYTKGLQGDFDVK